MKITITGPRSVGKSTISKLLAERLDLGLISSDSLADEALQASGGLDKAIKSRGIDDFVRNESLELIKKVYDKNNDFVFDLARGAVSSGKFSEISEKVRKIVKEKSKVIGLLPFEDDEKSIKFLFDREKNREHFKEMDEKKLFDQTEEDYFKFLKVTGEICKKIVYVGGKSVGEITEEIIKKIS